MQQARRTMFSSKDFVPSSCSPPFPYCWRPKFTLEHCPNLAKALGEVVAECVLEAGVLVADGVDQALSDANLFFDATTEDGTRYRIYRDGCREVRTIRANREAETVLAVFDIVDAQKPGTNVSGHHDNEHVVRITAYVRGSVDVQATSWSPLRYVAVLESRQGTFVATELSAEGSVTWEENPRWLAELRACGRVLRSVPCDASGLTLARARCHMEVQARQCSAASLSSRRKEFVWSIFKSAPG